MRFEINPPPLSIALSKKPLFMSSDFSILQILLGIWDMFFYKGFNHLVQFL